jgi:hypothetical protein
MENPTFTEPNIVPRRVYPGAAETIEIVFPDRLCLGRREADAAQLRAHAKPSERVAKCELSDVRDKVVIYKALVEGKLEAPKHLARTVQAGYLLTAFVASATGRLQITLLHAQTEGSHAERSKRSAYHQFRFSNFYLRLRGFGGSSGADGADAAGVVFSGAFLARNFAASFTMAAARSLLILHPGS